MQVHLARQQPLGLEVVDAAVRLALHRVAAPDAAPRRLVPLQQALRHHPPPRRLEAVGRRPRVQQALHPHPGAGAAPQRARAAVASGAVGVAARADAVRVVAADGAVEEAAHGAAEGHAVRPPLRLRPVPQQLRRLPLRLRHRLARGQDVGEAADALAGGAHAALHEQLGPRDLGAVCVLVAPEALDVGAPRDLEARAVLARDAELEVPVAVDVGVSDLELASHVGLGEAGLGEVCGHAAYEVPELLSADPLLGQIPEVSGRECVRVVHSLRPDPLLLHLARFERAHNNCAGCVVYFYGYGAIYFSRTPVNLYALSQIRGKFCDIEQVVQNREGTIDATSFENSSPAFLNFRGSKSDAICILPP